MRILLSWLEDFVEIRESPDELGHALTMAGMAVDAIEREDGETVFEFDLTSNRPDAMNHFGMAREVAALYGRPLRRPPANGDELLADAASHASIGIEDPDDCRRYVGRVFTEVRVARSPGWMRRRLELCGVRSINNIADLTNYVLLEMGQPTHAFDLDTLKGRRIVVRRAREGETLVTLDGERRDLSRAELAICDEARPVALAGVMGGLETEITGDTRNVLLEAAWFRPAIVRSASRRFKLSTEASHRFERGADWEAAARGADRIAFLLGESGSGSVLRGRIDCHPNPVALPVIRLRRERIRRILGASVERSRVESILASLGFPVATAPGGWTVQARSHRLDVTREIDLVEEVARIHGFDKIPATLPPVGAAPAAAKDLAADRRMRANVRGLGFDETIGFSFASSADARRFGGKRRAVRLRNPLSQLWAVLRNNTVPTMLQALEWNLKRNEATVRLAEFGRIYASSGDGFEEPRVLTLGACGGARAASWSDPARPLDFYDLKADVETLLRPFAGTGLRFDAQQVPGYYRRGHAARVRSGGRVLAYLGQLDPGIAAKRKIRRPLFLAEIFLDPLYRMGLRRQAHARLPKVPAVSRDFSLLVPDDVSFERVVQAVGDMPDLIALEPVEVYRGKNVPAGRYSLLLRAAWQRLDESLTDDEVNAFAERLRSALRSKLNIEPRV